MRLSAVACLLLAGAANGQTVLPGLGTADLRLNMPPTRQNALFSRTEAQDFVMIGGEAFVQSRDGARRPVDLGGPVAPWSPAAAGSDWVFFTILVNGAREGRLVNTATGARTDIRTDGIPVAAAISSESLAVLTANGSITLYRLESGSPTGKASPGLNPAFTMLSFASQGDLLAIDWSVPDVTAISVNGVAGVRRALQGAEVERSLAKARRVRAGNGEMREKIVLTHLVAANGNNLFFFGPFSRAEGLRLVEFDGNFQQVASYRLREGGPPSAKVTIAPNLISTGDGCISFLRQDGVVVSFERP